MRLKSRERLVKAMEMQKLSVRALAAECGLTSHSMIQQLRSGARNSCTPALAVRIAQALQVQPEFLFQIGASSGAGLSDQRGRVSA